MITIQQRLENIIKCSVGASTARHSPAGTINRAHAFFNRTLFGVLNELRENPNNLALILDGLTNELLAEIPGAGWGRSRKFINIVLNNCHQNYVIRNEFLLGNIERDLEVPLDRIVARRIRNAQDENHIPIRPWNTYLDDDFENYNTACQSKAIFIAAHEGCSRVELDILYWTEAYNFKITFLKTCRAHRFYDLHPCSTFYCN